MNQKRIQLTLFIDENVSESIEKIRKEFNPNQYELIKAHVTLCREDELKQIEQVLLNLAKLNLSYINIDFGKVIRFSEGKGVMIPAVGDNEIFQKLREKILEGVIEKPRKLEPHITLMHPRNATCTEEIFEKIKKIQFPSKIRFSKISLIEQEKGEKWAVLSEFKLNR